MTIKDINGVLRDFNSLVRPMHTESDLNLFSDYLRAYGTPINPAQPDTLFIKVHKSGTLSGKTEILTFEREGL